MGDSPINTMAAIKYDSHEHETGYDQIDAVSLEDTTIAYLRENGHFCDVCILVEDSPGDVIAFNAHKIILVAVSPYFQTLFQEDRLHQRIVMPASIKSTAFSLLLSWMYGKELSTQEVRQALIPDGTVSNFVDDLVTASSFLGLYRVASQLTNWKLGVKEEVRRDEFEGLEEDGVVDPLEEEDDLLESIKREEPDVDESEVTPSSPNKNPWAVEAFPEWINNRVFDNHSVANKKTQEKGTPKKRIRIRKKNVKSVCLTTGVGVGEKAAQEKDDTSRTPDEDGVAGGEIENHNQALMRVINSSECDVETSITTPAGLKDVNSDLFTINSSIESADASDILADYRDLSKDEVEKLFPNPRDRLYIGRKRTMNKLDPVYGNSDSWRKASEKSGSFLGKAIPYHNRTVRTEKLWNDVKKISGEIRGGVDNDFFELTTETGVAQSAVKFGNGEAACPYCDFVVTRPRGLKENLGYHLLNDHNYLWIDLALVCDLCDFIHMTEVKMKDHLNHIHGISTEQTIVCSKCAQKFASKQRMTDHRKNCLGEEQNKKDKTPVKKYPVQTHVCGTCGERRTSVYALENHMSHSHGVPFKFYCTQETCKYASNNRTQYTNHLFTFHKINVGENPILKCTFCEFVTTHPPTLKKHVAIHIDPEYLFKCPNEGCTGEFRQKRHLRKHMSICGIDLKLPCEYCGATFATKLKLKRHTLGMHTNRVRNYKCGYCDHATVARENCNTHVRRSHANQPMLVIDLRKLGLQPLPI